MFFLRYGFHACIQYSKCGLNIALYGRGSYPYRGTISCFSVHVIVLPVSPRIELPLEAALPHCSETFMSALNVSPKFFSFVVLPNTAPPILYSSFMFPCCMCHYLHFPKLTNICHFSNYLTDLSRSSCKLNLSV